MKLYKHKTSRDTAISIHSTNAEKSFVGFYNINYAKISGEDPLFLGYGYITLQNMSEYEVLNYDKK